MTIAFVQQAGGAATVAGQANTGAVGGTFTAGNLLVAVVSWSYSGVGGTVTIDVPSGWTSPLVTLNNGAPNGGSRSYYLANNAGGAQTWTWNATFGGSGVSQSWAWTILEFSGVATTTPLDLTAVNGATGASTSATLDTTAASGTTVSADLLVHLAGVARSAAGVLSTDTTNSVPTTGWTVKTQFDSTNGSPNAHASAQYNILAGTQASPRGVMTSTIAESNENILLTFKAAAGGGAAPDPYTPGIRIANRYVGPQVQRYYFRSPQERLTEAPITPPNDPNSFAWPIRIPNLMTGPPAQRMRFRQPVPVEAGPIATQGLVVTTQTQSGISGGPPGNNSTETDVTWVDPSGNGWRIGMIPAYGGALIAPWYEMTGNVASISQTSLATSLPDSVFHEIVNGTIGGFLGSENPTYTLAEIAPTGQGIRRYYDSGTTAQDSNGFTWRIRTCFQPGDPGMFYIRIDAVNAAPATVVTTNTVQDTGIGGLVQTVQGGGIAWLPANGVYGTVGGAQTSGWPSGLTAGEPDYFAIKPDAASTPVTSIMQVRGQTLATLWGSTNPQFQYPAITTRLKIFVQGDRATSIPANTYTSFQMSAVSRNMDIVNTPKSMAADFQAPDSPTMTAGTFTSHSNGEGAYIFAVTSNTLKFTHTFSGSVTKRWLPFYEVTGWTATTEGTITIGGTTLANGFDYLSYVDTGGQILYVKMLKGIVASGATAKELNNGLLTITTGGATVFTQVLTAILSFTGAFVKKTNSGMTGAVLTFTGPTNLVKAVTKGLVAAGLTFTGPVNLVKVTTKNLTAVLSFTGPVNLVRAITKGITAVLSFTGSNLKNAITKGMTATLSFTGPANLKNGITKTLVAGVLSFTGANIGKTFIKLLTATLTFTGPANLVKAMGKGMTAVLSFTGPTSLKNAVVKGMTGVLSFTGAQTKLTFKLLAIGTGLAFTGSLAAGKQFVRALVATLSFTGAALSKNINKSMTAGLTFTGASLVKAIGKRMTAGLSFTGTFVKFTSRPLSATLSFTGAFVKRTQKTLAAVLAFVGGVITSTAGGSHFVKALTATLSFSGTVTTTRFYKRALTATLGFVGSIKTPAQRSMAFVANMAASGNLMSLRWYIGTFKETSKGVFRAAYRGIRSIITQNRNMQ